VITDGREAEQEWRKEKHPTRTVEVRGQRVPVGRYEPRRDGGR
jgi:hypothetical protein